MTILTLLVEEDPLAKRTLQLLLESVGCEVYAAVDAEVLCMLLQSRAFDVMMVSTLHSNRDPHLIAEKLKRLQPSARVLLWGPVITDLPPSLKDYIDDQLGMPCTLAQLKSAVLPNRT